MTSRIPHSPLGRIVARRAGRAIEEALSDTRVVLVNGARQSGKSTLVAELGRSLGARWLSLDDPQTRQAAEFDLSGFVRQARPLIIDEVQRVPDLLLSIKAAVDEDGRPGHFLLTGSARVMGLRSVPDALPGRMETIELWPLSQGEIDGGTDSFVDRAFSEEGLLGVYHQSSESRADYMERLSRGGFPEAVARTGKRRARFFSSYIGDLINRDVMQLAEVQRAPEMRALVKLLAARSGQLLQLRTIGTELGLSHQTVQRYVGLLEEVFVVKRIPPWSRNLTTRAVATPKVMMVDSGIAAYQCGMSIQTLSKPGPHAGGLLENFVVSEIARQLSWSEEDVEMFHLRTRDQVEVDLVLENRRGQVVAIEVKAADTVSGDDFRGLRYLQDRLGDDLLAGVVLYTGTQTLPFGPKFRAMPIAALWEI
ncbi:ATP-binding protein [Nocardia sp. FBN12]|uniref:ATP-binding protein n=1 Tax=Nocardia sp. FBN12 TaxID=3419766 RepID=UPI003D0886C8